MNPTDFQFISQFIKSKSGIVLTPDKEYLLESRMAPIMRQNGFADLAALIGAIRGNPSGPLGEKAVEAMTTNESFFFRDKTPFDLLENTILPALKESRAAQKRVGIWSAAASTGQETYSTAMLLKECQAKFSGWQFDILGTDISKEVLEKAKAGTYSQFEVQRGLPIQLLVKYFKQIGETWSIDPAIKAMVEYKPFNLLDSFAPIGKQDVVFCRNVLIYFDKETKKDILERIADIMTPGGYLLLGAAETVVGVTEKFRPVAGKRGLYEMNSEAGQSAATSGLRSSVAG